MFEIALSLVCIDKFVMDPGPRSLSIGVLFLCVSSAVLHDCHAASEGDWIYYERNGEATVTGYTGAGGAVEIPSSFGGGFLRRGYPVTAVGDSNGVPVFSSPKTITNLVLPNTLKTIGKFAFKECVNVGTVVIPEGTTDIGVGAFMKCSQDLGAEKSLEKAGFSGEELEQALRGSAPDFRYGTPGLRAVRIPNTVTNIGEAAFAWCNGLTSVDVPDSVVSIGESAFWGCGEITNVVLGNGLETIGASAFVGCRKITGITFPSSLRSIGLRSFSGTGLTNVTIPSGVTSIETDAFTGCGSLATVMISDTVTRIDVCAFANCYSLTHVTIPRRFAEQVHGIFFSTLGLRAKIEFTD